MSTVSGVSVYKAAKDDLIVRSMDADGNEVLKGYQKADYKGKIDEKSPDSIWATTKDGKKEIFTKIKTADGKYVYILCNGGGEAKLPEPPKSIQNPIDQVTNSLGVQKKEKRSLTWSEKFGSFCKGLLKPVKAVVKTVTEKPLVALGVVAAVAATVAVGILFPPAAPVIAFAGKALVAAALVQGGAQMAYGAYKVAQADNTLDEGKGWESIGEGAFDIGTSLIGGGAAAKGAKAAASFTDDAARAVNSIDDFGKAATKITGVSDDVAAAAAKAEQAKNAFIAANKAKRTTKTAENIAQAQKAAKEAKLAREALKTAKQQAELNSKLAQVKPSLNNADNLFGNMDSAHSPLKDLAGKPLEQMTNPFKNLGDAYKTVKTPSVKPDYAQQYWGKGLTETVQNSSPLELATRLRNMPGDFAKAIGAKDARTAQAILKQSKELLKSGKLQNTDELAELTENVNRMQEAFDAMKSAERALRPNIKGNAWMVHQTSDFFYSDNSTEEWIKYNEDLGKNVVEFAET